MARRVFGVLFDLLAWAGALSLVVLVAWFGFLERPYLSYQNLPFPVLTEKVRQGDPVLVQVTRCSSDDRERVYGVGRVLVSLENGHTYVMPADNAMVRPGCNTITSTQAVVPIGVPPGRYYIRGLAEINSTIRSYTVGWSSQSFTVLP